MGGRGRHTLSRRVIAREDTDSGRVAALEAELARVRAEAAAQGRQLERYAADLRETFKAERAHRSRLQGSYRATVRALSNAVEARDAYTGKHAERVAAYGLAIARTMGSRLADDPTIEFGFLLHDVGKVAVPDAILYKPAALTAAERALMSRHPIVGVQILRGIEFLGEAKHVVRHHHERWDGDGYPDGLRGPEIPLAARVFAVADTLDALTTDRPYRGAVDLHHARHVIATAAGTQFDPTVVDAFASIPDDALDRIRLQMGVPAA
jgi:putative nucleotidyltransferase with HDIG domain